ncbi:MAG: hypothetical protein JWN78_850, partial [Bacteroidota bacterium]|nr:hypothetical protein [Bacteroidota bacterium]
GCAVICAMCIMSASHLQAQDAGDEAKEMFNKGKARDQKEIDEAIKGWWTNSMKTHDQRVEWWRKAKFGMFIHWGIYSLPAGEWKGKKVSGYAEHLMRKEQITRKDYLEVAHQFNPVNFNADEWARTAKNAGMRYMIITSKHHDGFAMFDSHVSDFNIMKQTPFGRDPMKELSAACKKYGIKFGFYYSHAFDWEHPDAPGNDWEYNNPGGDKNLFGGVSWYDQHPELLVKAQKYVNDKAIPQIKELLLKYHPDILWFDTPQKLPLSENIKILKAIRETDPNVVVNGRLVRNASANFGDYKNTADRPAEFYPVSGDWEAIPTTNESYGYSKFDSSHKPVSHFIRLLASAASRGGNLLLNIGPKGDGTFDARDMKILNGIGSWMNKNSESIYGTTAGKIPFQNWGVSTTKDNKIYLHVYNWPSDKKLYVGGLKTLPSKVYFLAGTKSALTFTKKGNDVIINLPLNAPDTINTVIIAEFKSRIEADSVSVISPNISQTRLLAFDAKQQGKGFGFGDGKTDRYYVEGWKSKDQSLSWAFRTEEPAEYKMLIAYVTGDKVGGNYEITIDDIKLTKNVNANTTVKPVWDNLVTTKLNAGLHTITIKPLEIKGTELMKPLEIQLTKHN